MQGMRCYECGHKVYSHGYQPNDIQRFLCINSRCPVLTFNSRKHTLSYRMKLSNKDVYELVYLFFTGYPISNMAELKKVTEQCIRDTLKKTITHFKRFERLKVSYEDYFPRVLQVDEIWIKLQGKRIFFGWIAYDPKNKIMIDFEIGGRDKETLKRLFIRLKKYRKKIELVLIDGYGGYKSLIMKYLGKKRFKPVTGVINKSRYSKKLNGFLTYGLFGKNRKTVEELIREFWIGNRISISLIERFNRDFRDGSSYLKRRTPRLCRILSWIKMWMYGFKVFHNICKPHWKLSERSSKNWIKKSVTPAMSVNACKKVFSIEEILMFPIPH